MKKTFQLEVASKNRDRILDAIKHEIRKYIRRERRRDLPPGADYWDFDCRFGATEESAQPAHNAALMELIDGVASSGGAQFYLEILAKPGYRTREPAEAAGQAGGN